MSAYILSKLWVAPVGIQPLKVHHHGAPILYSIYIYIPPATPQLLQLYFDII